MAEVKTAKENRIKKSTGDKVTDVIIYTGIGLVGLCTLLPFLYVIAGSFATEKELTERAFFIIPREFSLNAYNYIVKTGDIFKGLRNSIYLTVVGTMVNMFFTTTFAYPLSKAYMRGRNALLNMCSRSKFLSKIFKINVKNFREIFPDFTHRKKGSEFITVPFLSSGSHVLRLPSAFLFLVPCLEYTLSVLQQSSLTPHISGLYALLSN